MVNRIVFGKLAKQAKAFVDQRGGTEALSAEAQRLKDIAKGKGSISDKAKEAAASAQSFATAKPGDSAAAGEGQATHEASVETQTAPPSATAPATPVTPSEPPAFED